MNKEEMLQLRLAGYSYQYIARVANLSRQRIHQLLSPPKEIRDFIIKKYEGFCVGCGIYVGSRGHVHHVGGDTETYNDIENLVLLCISCHRKEHAANESKCLYCGNRISRGSFCSRECYLKYHEVKLQCPVCGKQFSMTKSIADQRMKRSKTGKIYCSRKCHGKINGKMIGERYGFRQHPENINI